MTALTDLGKDELRALVLDLEVELDQHADTIDANLDLIEDLRAAYNKAATERNELRRQLEDARAMVIRSGYFQNDVGAVGVFPWWNCEAPAALVRDLHGQEWQGVDASVSYLALPAAYKAAVSCINQHDSAKPRLSYRPQT